MIQVPFGRRKRVEVEVIEADGATLYLKKTGSLTPNERPKAMQELENLHKELQQILLLIAESIQQDYPVEIGYAYLKAGSLRRHSRDNAQSAQQVVIESFLVEEDPETSEEIPKIKVAEGVVALSPNDWVKLPTSQAPLIINRVLGNDWYEILPINVDIEPGTVGEKLNLKIGQYASDTEVKRIGELNEKAPDVAIQAATLFMEFRALRPVEGVSAVKAGAEFIRVQELNIELQAGDRLKFLGDGRPTILEVAQGLAPSDDDEEYVDIRINPSPGAIAADTVGYLMDGKSLKAGLDGWTEGDTRNLPDSLIAEIFKFHQAESSPKKEESGDEESRGKGFAKKDEKSSSKSGRKRRSTGTNTTGESKAIESATPDSTTKTLEAAHAA